MTIADLLSYLETIAPPAYQESYDNAGLIVGDASLHLKGVLICLDSIEAVVEEAIQKKCNLIIAHHPIIFKGLKRLNGSNYIERTIIKAIKNNIAIYAIHTNLDNVYYNGVNTKIAEKLDLVNTRILAPKKTMKKLFTFVPTANGDSVRKALFDAGAGGISTEDHLSYASLGIGTQNGSGGPQLKLEVLFETANQRAVLKALKNSHPKPDVPYDIISVENSAPTIGAGIIGELPQPTHEKPFLQEVKKRMNVSCVKYTKLSGRKISKIAICGGSGGFLLGKAIAQKADIFITSDYKYHEFFDADAKIVIADIGHYESEQYTIELLYEIITNKFSNFAVYCTKVNTNPVNYI